MRSLDELDLAILRELERNARVSVSELARRLDTPNTTLRDRIKRLEEDSVILGYAARINPEKIGYGIKAVIQITRDQTISLSQLLAEPTDLPEIVGIQILTGDTDELITIYARDVDHLKEIIYNKFSRVPGLLRMSTAIVLEEETLPLSQTLLSEDLRDPLQEETGEEDGTV